MVFIGLTVLFQTLKSRPGQDHLKDMTDMKPTTGLGPSQCLASEGVYFFDAHLQQNDGLWMFFDGIYYDLLLTLWCATARLLVSSWICNTLVLLRVNSKDGIIHPWICLESHCLCRWWPARCLPWVWSKVGRSNPFRTSISWCFLIS